MDPYSIAKVWGVLTSDFGWFWILLFVFYQVWCPVGETHFQKLESDIRDDKKLLSKKLDNTILVIRALARSDPRIDDGQVDDILTDTNGTGPEDLMHSPDVPVADGSGSDPENDDENDLSDSCSTANESDTGDGSDGTIHDHGDE